MHRFWLPRPLRARALLLLALLLTQALTPLDTRAQAGAPLLALVSPDPETTLITRRDQSRIMATLTNAQGGAPPATLRFTLEDATGAVRFQRDDPAPPYCAVDDPADAAACAPLDPAPYDALRGHDLLLTVAVRDAAQPSQLTWPLHIAGPPPTDAPDAPADLSVLPPQDAVLTADAGGGPTIRWVVPAPGAVITRRTATAFQLQAFDPAIGTTDGAGIAQVVVQLQRDGVRLAQRTERTPAYCLFGGDTPCLPLSAARWADLTPGTYTLRAQATSRSGITTDWVTRTVTIVPDSPDSPDDPPPAGASQTFRSSELPPDAPAPANPMRGLYRWLGQETAPQPQPARDSYDRYLWRDLEPHRGQYDFGPIERDLAAAARAGRAHGIRIRALATGGGRAGPQVPDYLVSQMGRGWWHDYDGDGRREAYVPDWNDPDFLERAAALIRALGARFNGDPRLAWVDIGLFGNWGEWHMARFPYPSPSGAQAMTTANRRAIVDWHQAAFPATPLVMLTDDAATLRYALEQSPTIGWRRDSLGWTHFDALERLDAPTRALLADRWQTAPVITEFGNVSRQVDPGSLQLARDQVRRYHISLVGNGNTFAWGALSTAGRAALQAIGATAGYRIALTELTLPAQLAPGQPIAVRSAWVNRGVAPSYQEWRPTLELRDGAGQVAWRGDLGIDLRTLLPSDQATHTVDSLTLPPDLPAGSYALALTVRDPSGARAPLALAIAGGADDGSYRLGTVQIGAATGRRARWPNRVVLPLIAR